MAFIFGLIKKLKVLIFIVIIVIIIIIIVKIWKLKGTIKEMLTKEANIADKIMKKGVMGSFLDIAINNITQKENDTKPEENDKQEKDYDIGSFIVPKKEAKISRPIVPEPEQKHKNKIRRDKPGRDKVRRSNSKVSKNKREELCRKVFEDYFDDYFPTVRPKFLKNPKTGRPLELDGYNARLSLAFETQGYQHTVYPNAFHKTREEFDKQVERDLYKKQRCKELEIELIEIDYSVPIENTEAYIHGELKKLGY